MISAIGSRSFLMKTLLCVFSVLLLTGCAAAWEQSFEGSDYDLPTSYFTSGSVVTYQNSNLYSGTTVTITSPGLLWNGYLGFSWYKTSSSQNRLGVALCYANGTTMTSTNTYLLDPYTSNTWERIEVKENTAGTELNVYIDGALCPGDPITVNGDLGQVYKIVLTFSGTYSVIYTDDYTTSSSHAIVACDKTADVIDTGQYFRIGVPPVSSPKYYYVEVFSPLNQKVFTETYTTSNYLNSHLIPIANLSSVGDYVIHLYRQDDDDSATFVNMKTFEVVDAVSTGEGSIVIDKTAYEAGDTVKVWTQLNDYKAGYTVRCDFDADGTNFRKTLVVTGKAFYGTFTIPEISNVLGSHTVYLLNPSGNVVDFADFDVYIQGLPDIAFDKATYERSDTALLYYKDVKDDSTVRLVFRYGGTTAQTLEYPIEGTGTLRVNLSSLAAADSVLAVLKDSDGYSKDQDNADIVVGNFLLSGRVYNAKTGSIIPGATVTVQGTAVNSDNNGNYNLTALAGFANYSVVSTGYNSISGTVAVFDLDTIHNFYLSPVLTNAGTGVYGTVVSSKTDYPLVGASVEVTNTDNLKRFSTIVDNKGFYSLSNDDLAGNLSIRVSFNNYDSIVATATVTSGSMQNHNFRLNAVPGYTEIDPSEHTGGQDSSDTGETAEEKAYREKYGEMGRHPFDFNGDGTVENSEWKYAGERFVMLIGILAFMGFLMLINRRR